ncbi:tetratricopeptide repeat protein [Polyangium sorediatum]|uniref:Tetratricopeptide repeat protein n=1 Tax=Polyangium sorediatum TaxID=889274 RepID=A0ABT6NQT4_9BACT|nr:tetratricopeptide repeat protein [Polyangium sorediatum]MDI1430687.1 tetratricopeptide repeat protein [Polyangium sorediatum]
MVLPAPPPDDAPREGAWLDAILRELKLAGEGRGLLVLVDHARPERLRDLVLALLPTYPDVEVYTDVRAVYEVPEGAVMVLAPRAEDADWLNQQRPVFARRKLKVILWCEAETSVALAQKAVDFFDWISHRHECPPGVPMHAVFGIRSALCARAPGIAWVGDNLEECFRVALPGRRLVHLSARLSYKELVQAIRSAGCAWIVLRDVKEPFARERAEKALHELRIRTRVFWDSFSNWTLDGRCSALDKARAIVAALGTHAPGRLVALAGLEPDAVDVVAFALRCGVSEPDLQAVMQSATDPGAAAVALVERHAYPVLSIFWRSILWRGGFRHREERRPDINEAQRAWAAFFSAKDALHRGELGDASIWALSWFIGEVSIGSVEHTNALRGLALVQSRQGKFDVAVSNLRKAIRVAEVRLGPDDPFLGGLYGDLAEVLAQKGDFDEAKRLAERAFQIEKSIPSLSSPYMSRAYKRFAYIQSLEDAAAAQAEGRSQGSG